MSQSNSSTVASIEKTVREQFGITGQPIPAKRVWVKDMNFDHDGVNVQNGTVTRKIETKTWIIDTGDGRRVVVNTYDGKTGKNFDPAVFNYPMPQDEAGIKKMTKKYAEVAVSECPVAVAIGGTTEAPATPEAPKVEEPAPTTGTDVDGAIDEAPATTPRRGRRNA